MGGKTLGGGKGWRGGGGWSQKLSRVMRGDHFGVITFKRGIGHVSQCLPPNLQTPLPPFSGDK